MGIFSKKHPPTPPASDLHCSFCNKNQRYVKKLIAGPNVYICDECVDICLDIINMPTRSEEKVVDPPPTTATVNCSICRFPFFAAEGLHLEARGVLCPACVAAVQAALAQ